MTETEVIGYLKTLSNWGRWGAEDQLGTLNLITPAKRLAAARLVRDGVPVTCARPAPHGRRPLVVAVDAVRRGHARDDGVQALVRGR